MAFGFGTSTGFPDIGALPTDFVSFDCFSSTYGVMLGALGLDPAVLGDEWGYRYESPVSRRDGLPFPLPRLYRVPMRDKIAAWYGLQEIRTPHATAADALAHTLAAVRDGRWVIVEADTYYLRHTGFSRRLHYPHRVVVARADRDRAFLIDAYRGSTFRGWVPTGELLAALSRADLPPDAMEYPVITTTEVVVPHEPRPADGERVLAAIHDSVGHYFAASGPGADRSGREAIEDFREDLLAARDSAADLNGDLVMDYLAFFGEVASQRLLNARFVAMAAALCPADGLAEAVDGFAVLAEQWLKLRTVYFVGTTGRRPAADVVRKIATRLASLLAQEREAVQTLARTLPEVDGR